MQGARRKANDYKRKRVDIGAPGGMYTADGKKEIILRKLKEQGYRITKQRVTVIDVILEYDCGSYKEIIYEAGRRDQKIGAATVYRTMDILETIGVIERRNFYKVLL